MTACSPDQGAHPPGSGATLPVARGNRRGQTGTPKARMAAADPSLNKPSSMSPLAVQQIQTPYELPARCRHNAPWGQNKATRKARWAEHRARDESRYCSAPDHRPGLPKDREMSTSMVATMTRSCHLPIPPKEHPHDNCRHEEMQQNMYHHPLQVRHFQHANSCSVSVE